MLSQPEQKWEKNSKNTRQRTRRRKRKKRTPSFEIFKCPCLLVWSFRWKSRADKGRGRLFSLEARDAVELRRRVGSSREIGHHFPATGTAPLEDGVPSRSEFMLRYTSNT